MIKYTCKVKQETEKMNGVNETMDEDYVLAKDIDGCVNCPLYENVCCGDWTSDGAGYFVDPPCAGWEPEEEVYRSMYDFPDFY